MLKRAVITDEISQDFERAVILAKGYGLDGVELRSAWDRNPHELAGDQLNRIASILAAHGMLMPCVAAPVFKCQLHSESEFQAHLEILRRSAEIARMLGAGLVRGFTFWADSQFDTDLPLIVERLRKAEPILSNAGVTLVIEYDPATSASTTQKLEKVLSRLSSEHIRALFDPGNNIYDPEGEPPFPQGYERLKPWIEHIHVKDVVRNTPSGKPEAVVIGEGDVGFRELFARLMSDGFTDWASLETHYRKAAAISDTLLHRPMGSAFSEGGEEASIECLEAWNRIMHELGMAN